MDYRPIQNTFRRFGSFLENNKIKDAYIVARRMAYANPMSFEKYSNIMWDTQMGFKNGGMNVNLLKYQPGKKNKPKETVKAYIAEY